MLYFPSLVCWNGKFGSQLCGLFDSTENRPCLGSCGHSVCTPCLDKNPNIKCPICGLENAFIDRKINYTALNFIEMFSENCVEVYKNWWQVNQETIGEGYCTHCATDCQSLRLCVTCELSAPSPIVEYHEEENLVSLKIDKVSVAKLPLSLKCANCIADNDHENHRVIKLKDVKNSAIRIKDCSHDVANRFLKRGLENSKGRDCMMRYDRMIKTCQRLGQEIQLICYRASEVVLFEAERKDLTDEYEKVSRYLDCLKAHWIDFQKNSEESCDCTKLWKQSLIQKISHALAYGDMESITPGCPLALEKNLGFWVSIPFKFEVDKKGNLKDLKELKTSEETATWRRIIGKALSRQRELRDSMESDPSKKEQESTEFIDLSDFKPTGTSEQKQTPKDPPNLCDLPAVSSNSTLEQTTVQKLSDLPSTSMEASKPKQELQGPKDLLDPPAPSSEPLYATMDQMKSLYEHVKNLTIVVENLVKQVAEDRAH